MEPDARAFAIRKPDVLAKRLAKLVQRFLGSTPIGPNLKCMLSLQPTQTAGRFRLRNDYFACEQKNFAYETILFRNFQRSKPVSARSRRNESPVISICYVESA